MFPKLFTVPPFSFLGRTVSPTLHTYGVLLAIAFLVSLWVAGRQAKKAGLDAGRVADMAVYVLIAGLVGAKLLLLVVEFPYYSKNPGEIGSLVQSGGVFYGGLLLAIPVAFWCISRYGLDRWRTADALAPAVAIGQSIGRLGCFAAGCCFGRPAAVPWAVTFHSEYAARAVGTPLDIPLHPTQIYESIACLALFFFLIWITPRKRFHGQVLVTYAAAYATIRFVIEFFRGDAARGTVLGGILTTSQFIAILMMLGVLLVTPYLVRSQAVSPAAPATA